MNQQQQALTVLLVEDDIEIRALLKEFLESRGHKIVEAANGKQAIEASTLIRPDIILLDLFMPIQDGFSAAQHMRRDFTSTQSADHRHDCLRRVRDGIIQQN
ncbi:MAG: response regulator [Pyrinomonadaceae bacterium]